MKSVPKTISGTPDWWEQIDREAESLNLDRSAYIRFCHARYRQLEQGRQQALNLGAQQWAHAKLVPITIEPDEIILREET